MTYKFGLQIVLCKFGVSNSVLLSLVPSLSLILKPGNWRSGEIQTRGNSFDRSVISQLIHQLIRQIENSNPSDTGDIDGILFRADWLYNCFIVRYVGSYDMYWG